MAKRDRPQNLELCAHWIHFCLFIFQLASCFMGLPVHSLSQLPSWHGRRCPEECSRIRRPDPEISDICVAFLFLNKAKPEVLHLTKQVGSNWGDAIELPAVACFSSVSWAFTWQTLFIFWIPPSLENQMNFDGRIPRSTVGFKGLDREPDFKVLWWGLPEQGYGCAMWKFFVVTVDDGDVRAVVVHLFLGA